jgi:hypothetical protein
MSQKVISVSRDYSETPAGRFKKDGPKSGEEFREEFLVPSLRSGKQVVVQLDGVLGYGSSFLEEAFGGLVRSGFSEQVLRSQLVIQCSYPIYLARVWRYISDAAISYSGSKNHH